VVAAATLFGGLGYLPPYPESWVDAAELTLADEAACLSASDLYVLSPDMCDVVVAAAEALTRDDLALARESDLPSPSGLVILPRPLVVRSVRGDLGDDRAYTWSSPATVRHPGFTIPAIRISCYHDTSGPVRPDSFLDFAARARRAGTPLPPLLLNGIRSLPLGRTPRPGGYADQLAATARRIGDETRGLREAAGHDENRLVGEYAPGGVIDDADDTFGARFLYAFWRLCEQRIAAVSPAPVNHSALVTCARARVPA
jgi:hypothetical protein